MKMNSAVVRRLRLFAGVAFSLLLLISNRSLAQNYPENYPENISYYRYFGEGYYCSENLEDSVWIKLWQDMSFMELYKREHFKSSKAYPRVVNGEIKSWTRHDLGQYGDPQMSGSSFARQFLASLSETPCAPSCPTVRIHGLPFRRITVRCKP